MRRNSHARSVRYGGRSRDGLRDGKPEACATRGMVWEAVADVADLPAGSRQHGVW